PERRGKKARLAGSGRGVKLRFRPWRKVNVSFPSAQRANLRSIRNLLSTPRAKHSGSSLKRDFCSGCPRERPHKLPVKTTCCRTSPSRALTGKNRELQPPGSTKAVRIQIKKT